MRIQWKALILCLILTPAIIGVSRWAQSREAEGGMMDSESGEPSEGGLQFRLGEGQASTFEPRRIEPAAAAPLPDADAQKVLSRLQPIEAPSSDQQEFALRPSSLPPPLTGATVQGSFPPAHDVAVAETPVPAALEVLRFSPEGEVPLAPNVSVTFSQPMVALTSIDDLSKMPVPVKMTPSVPGSWRWVGAKTVVFDADGERLPMATEFSAEVPAGTKSATGGVLAAAKTWTFKTPPTQVQQMIPQGGPLPLQPVVFMSFDQRIKLDAVLPTIRVEAGGEPETMHIATTAEIEADPSVKAAVAGAQEGRWIALAFAQPLPPATTVTVTVGPGTPSAEGPRKTETSQTFQFSTYGPFEVTESYCNWRNECPPMSPWTVVFSNPVAPKSIDRSKVKVEPELPGLKIGTSGNYVTIQGRSAGRTTYKVTLDPSIRDIFGQTLNNPKPLSFAVGSAQPSLYAPGGQFVVLDPSGGAKFTVYTVNHRSLRVGLYAVTPEDWGNYAKFMKDASYDRRARLEPPGQRVQSTNVEVAAKPDELVETRLDLSPALKDGLGHVIVVIEPPPGWRKLLGLSDGYDPRIIAWVSVTKIGLDAFVDNEQLLAWATSLSDGKPLQGVSLTIAPQGTQGTSGADGLATIALPDQSAAQSNVLIGRMGPDAALLPEGLSWWNEAGSWTRSADRDSARWYVYDDRQMYRPGEEVHLKGWVRRIVAGKKGDIAGIEGASKQIHYKVSDSRGNEVLHGDMPVTALGGFDGSFKIPDTMNLGYTRIDLDAGSGLAGDPYAHSIQVQEFRRPEFEVSASASDGPHFGGESLTATVKASYYAGGGLPGAEVSWHVTTSKASFSPPNWDDFTFGTWTPWWWGEGYYGRGGYRPQGHSETFSGQTDASGEHHLRVDLLGVDPPEASTITAEASVMDVNRQAWAASTSALVHPAATYVGLRSPRTFVQAGQPLVVEAIVADLDGKAIVANPIELKAVRMDWTEEGGEWRQVEVDPQTQTLQSADKPVQTQFAVREGGTYKVSALIRDAKGRRNRSELTLWVAGGKTPANRNVEQEKVTLIPDRKDYKPGDTAEILVQAPFYPAEGLLTLRRGGILSHERFTMTDSTQTLKVALTEDQLPSLAIQVDLVGSATRATDTGEPDPNLPRRPAFAAGTLSLPISLASRTLAVAMKPRDEAVEPGGETEIEVELRDSTGAPVADGEVAVAVVDEAILALSGYKAPELLSAFYLARDGGVRDYHQRTNVQLANPEELQDLQEQGVERQMAPRGRMMMKGEAMPMAAPAPAEAAAMDGMFAMGGAGGEASTPIKVRSDFNPLALFAPALKTDATGHAKVSVKLPDSLTRYRIVALAVAGVKQYGQAESTLTARLPLMVRPSAPRFLNFGDRFELPVVVQNQTNAPLSVDVAVRATGVELLAGSGRRTTVPANDRVEVRFPMETKSAGTARFQIGGASGKWADAAEVPIRVGTPATTEAFATYGELDGGTAAAPATIVQPVQAPANVFPQFGGLEVTTSSTQLQALTDALLYLYAYPFECAEQISSRVLAVAALRDVLTAFQAEGLPPAAEIEAAMARDIERLHGLQESNGGFSFWRRGDQNWPYVSIHVAHALQRAKEKGFAVPDDMLERSRSYLQNVQSYFPSNYSEETKRVLRAYALYVRKRLGDLDAAGARKLYAEQALDKWSFEALGWMLPVLAADKGSQATTDAILRHLQNRVAETAAAAHFVTSYGDQDYLLLHSDRRVDGILLEALIEVQPNSDLIPKLVRGLLDHRTAGRWTNTQENAFILLALDRYFNTYEKLTPDYVSRVWLGSGFAGEHAFRGRTTERHNIDIPMRYLVEGEPKKDLVVSKDGPGRLYYRLGLRYAPKSLKLDPSDQGFVVVRSYEAVDKPEDVRRDGDGVWHIKAGSRVRVHLTMVAPGRRTHVALVDPLPAGLEAMNPALAVTGSVPEAGGSDVTLMGASGMGGPSMRGASWWWWRGVWFEHQNLRDERAEAFASLLFEGVYEYRYVARATTPGSFVVPPPKAEEMYHPETFGRGGTDRVVVE